MRTNERQDIEASAAPLYPVKTFGDTAVVGRVARFGGFIFASTDQGWRIVDQIAPAGTVETED
jgi:hypothetical protein